MKNIFDNVPFRLGFFSSSYIILLIFISPFIDHLFTSLEEDKKKKENNFQILVEIILHIIVLTISWYYLNKYLRNFLEKILGINIKVYTKTVLDFVAALALIGLQKNLIDKLKYISFEHPFRGFNDLYG